MQILYDVKTDLLYLGLDDRQQQVMTNDSPKILSSTWERRIALSAWH